MRTSSIAPVVRITSLPVWIVAALFSCVLAGCDDQVVPVPHEPPGAGSTEEIPPTQSDEPPITITADAADPCPIGIGIHVPPAQNPAIPLVADAATRGAITLRNNDIDVDPASLATRLTNSDDLLRVEGTPDSALAPVATEDDLVRIDLVKAQGANPVFLNAYAMALEDGENVPAKNGPQLPLLDDQALHFFRHRSKAAPVALPYTLTAEKESLWVEGHKAGRYRLVLFLYPDGDAAKARTVTAREQGDPHQTPAAPQVTLNPPLQCSRNARLTVAVNDIYQEDRREHVFDVMWGGRARIDVRLWPPNGVFTWATPLGGNWINGRLRSDNVRSNGNAASGGNTRFANVHGGWVPGVVPAGQPVQGSGLYDARLRLDYDVEGVTLGRAEPLTLMVPHSVQIVANNLGGFNVINRGGDRDFAFQVTYEIYEQNARVLKGPSAAAYTRQYGARLRMYEALGGVANLSRRTGYELFWAYNDPDWTEIRLGTAPRTRAVPTGAGSTNSAGRFNDNFAMNLTARARRFFDVAVQTHTIADSATIFSALQDIVALLNNDQDLYDVRVARGNRLEAVAPETDPANNRRGPIGFRLILGAGGGTSLNTGNPDRVTDPHVPQ